MCGKHAFQACPPSRLGHPAPECTSCERSPPGNIHHIGAPPREQPLCGSTWGLTKIERLRRTKAAPRQLYHAWNACPHRLPRSALGGGAAPRQLYHAWNACPHRLPRSALGGGAAPRQLYHAWNACPPSRYNIQQVHHGAFRTIRCKAGRQVDLPGGHLMPRSGYIFVSRGLVPRSGSYPRCDAPITRSPEGISRRSASGGGCPNRDGGRAF